MHIAYKLQKKVFRDLGRGVLDNAWQGYNAALFAYGQTGSGKSYSMVGYGANRGIVPITCSELFTAVEQNQDNRKQFQVYGKAHIACINSSHGGMSQDGNLRLRRVSSLAS